MLQPRVLERIYAIRPSDIDVRNMKTDGTVDSRRVEITARWIVYYMIDGGDVWKAFTRRALYDYYRDECHIPADEPDESPPLLVVDQLVERGYLSEDAEGRLWVTDILADRFHAQWPMMH